MRNAKIWAGLAGVAVVCVLIYMLRGVLTPFLAGAAIAYFLDPLADRLERLGCSRTLAVTLIIATFFLIVILALALLIPVIQAQVTGFLDRVPGYIDSLRAQAGPLIDRLRAALPEGQMQDLRSAAGEQAGTAIKWVGGFFSGMLTGGVALLNLISLIIVMPLVAFYMLRDWDRMVRRIDELLPGTIQATVREQAAEIDRTLSAFVRGQALVCFMLGAFYAVGLSLVGLEFGIVVGFGTGVMSFIPYFGMGLGLIVGMGIAFAQFSDWVPIALTAGVFAVGQFIEGNFLTPRLVGDRVGLHPVWVIFAVMAGGALLGFTGVILAIPVAATIGVLVRFAVERYRQSRHYALGGDAER
jgi:predicted PurR-regulated permease PerM